MTFYEAAVEVLRRTGRPLHYKKITEIAVRENLLSHVGKTPDETMSDRLEKEVKKNEGSVIDQKRPGVFQLDDEEGAEELIERIKEKQKARKKRSRNRDDSHNDTRQHNGTRQRSDGGGGDSDGDADGRKRRRSRGSKSQPAAKKRKRDDGDESTRARKRKRTRGGDDRDDDQRSNDQRGDDNQRSDDRQDADDSGERRRRRRRRSSNDDGGKRQTEAPSISAAKQTHLEEGPVRLEGIPKAAYKVLDENGGGSVPIDELADKIFEQKLVKFHTHDPVTTVKSALANDNQIRSDRGHRSLFDHDDHGNWWLTKRHLSPAVFEKEQAILSLTEEVRRQSMEQLGDLLVDIRPEALEYLALTLLERLGYYNIKVSKRSSEGDVFFTADWRQGLADVRVCVRVVTDSDRTLKASAVEDLRETLDHYSASEGVAIHLGDVAGDAVGRARINGEAPITLFDRDTFVELLVKHGIGVETYQSPLVMVDSEFIDALAD